MLNAECIENHEKAMYVVRLVRLLIISKVGLFRRDNARLARLVRISKSGKVSNELTQAQRL
jgi:hypothetical protein